MDPRHPEQAISRMRELMKQYNRIEADMNNATTSAQLAQLEREGGLVVQEICLVAPRIHEAMMQASRRRRYDLAHGVVEKPVEKSEKYTEMAEVLDHSMTKEQEQIFEEMTKPKKKTTRRKKTAKKKEDN